jgi:hypothetical protein
MMRKITMLAIALVAIFGVVAVAEASNTYTVTDATVTPSKAGTAKKPKPVTIKFGYSVGETAGNRPSVTTDYEIAFGKQIKSQRKYFKGKNVCTIAQAGYTSGTAPACPATSKAGQGTINNLAGVQTDPTSKIQCDLGLTLYVGDGKAVPAANNDGIPVKNDLVIAIKNRPPLVCPLSVDAALPAGFVVTSNGTALKFHVKKIPFQQPNPGLDNSVVHVDSTVGKTVKVRTKVGVNKRTHKPIFKNVSRGLFESVGCKSKQHAVNVKFTPAGGGAALTAFKPAPCS